jgi:hypothetical protein
MLASRCLKLDNPLLGRLVEHCRQDLGGGDHVEVERLDVSSDLLRKLIPGEKVRASEFLVVFWRYSSQLLTSREGTLPSGLPI